MHSSIKPIDFISTSANWQHFHDEDGLCATTLCSVHACTYFLDLTTHEHPTNRNGCPTNRHSHIDLNAVHLRYTVNIAQTQGTVYLPESRPLFLTHLLPYSTRNARNRCCRLISVERNASIPVFSNSPRAEIDRYSRRARTLHLVTEVAQFPSPP